VPPDEADLAGALGLDAGELTPVDPPAPAGDLKSEADAFTDLEACVKQRARVDPVLGDAIDALGYDTLLRDACRVVEAVKTSSPAPCEPIAASSLRDRCFMSAAVVMGDSMQCPMAGQNHDGLCVALARRDLRLCASVPLERRGTCRAMLQHEPKRCGGDKRCERMVERWKGLIPAAESKPELGTKVRLEVTAKVDGRPDKPVVSDLSQAVPPATVYRSPSGVKLMVGETSSAAWPPFRVAPDPRLALMLLATPENLKQGVHPAAAESLQFEVLVPNVGQFSSKNAAGNATLTVDLLGLEIGSPVRFSVEVDIGEPARGHHLSLNINTFVRDVVTTNRP
jgi:hypothetical protein